MPFFVRACLAALWVSTAVVAAPSNELPDLGASTSTIMTVDKEQLLGDQLIRSVKRQLPIIYDPLLSEYIRNLGFSIAKFSDNTVRHFDFFMVDDQSINAFAMPGGYIGINTGMFLTMNSEGELAAVIAHEIAHVTQRHIARHIERSASLSIPTMIAMLSSIILATQNTQAGLAALSATRGIGRQISLNFSRSNETEADRIGIKYLARAGIDPRYVPSTFEKMQAAGRSYGYQVPEYLRTHPVPINRIADSRGRAESYPKMPTTSSRSFHIIRTNIQVEYSNNLNDAINYYKQALAEQGFLDKEFLRYGYVLALTEKHQFVEARRQITTLLKSRPQELAYLLAQIDIEIVDDKYQQAEAFISNSLKLKPDDDSLQIRLAKVLTALGQSRQAAKLLSRMVRKDPGNVSLFQQLWVAHGLSNNQAGVFEARAEYLFNLGDYEGAIKQIRFSLDVTDKTDLFEVSRLKARQNQFLEILARFTRKD